MPYINIRMTKEGEEPTINQKQRLIKGITELFEEVMGRSGKNAVVIIDEIEPFNYGIGSKSISEIRKDVKG